MSRAILSPPARISLFVTAALATVGLLLSVAAPNAAAAKPCWERVIDDWIDNGQVDARYSTACLRASLDHVPEDVRAYSDFEDKIKQAIQANLRQVRLPQGRGSGGSGPGTSPADPRQVEELAEEEQSVEQQEDGEGPIQDAMRYGTKDASTIPLPLIILAVLALILLSAGAVGVAHRKLQARKVRSS